MKDYKRLTEKCYSCPVCENGKCLEPEYNCEEKQECEAWNRLFDIENKIESGELCDREEVRRETAEEILKSMLNKMYKLTGCGVPYHVKKFMEEIAMEYGVELFGNSDKLEDEE